MPNELPMNDPRNIWQNQPKEPFKMSVDQMRLKVHRFQIKARFKVLYAITIGLSICVFFGWNCIRAQEVLSRMGFGLLSVCGIYFAYQAYKWIWPRNLPQDAPVSTSLEFYRSELERRRDYSRHVWRRSGLTFCFLGLVMALAPGLNDSLDNPRLLVNTVPFFALLIIWFVAFFYLKKRGQHELQREIDELRAFERDR
jgi:uncharacterized membrane protein YfcA